MRFQTKFKAASKNSSLGRLELHFINATTVKGKKKDLPKKIKWEGPIATFFKCGHSFSPKNAAIAQENVALDSFYGRMFKMQPLLFL